MTVRVSPDLCHVCSSREFAHTPVLWTELVSTWGLAREEAEYIDIQQGTHCVKLRVERTIDCAGPRDPEIAAS